MWNGGERRDRGNHTPSRPRPDAERFAPSLSRYGIFLLLPALLLLGGAISPAFLSANNISNLLLQVAPLGIVAIGQCFVMIVRGLDLSVASTMATAAVIATGFSGANGDVAGIVAVALMIGLAAGLINGWLITRRQVSPFLATLATMILLQGFRFAYTQGAPSGNVPPLFRTLGSGQARRHSLQFCDPAGAGGAAVDRAAPFGVRPPRLHRRRQPGHRPPDGDPGRPGHHCLLPDLELPCRHRRADPERLCRPRRQLGRARFRARFDRRLRDRRGVAQGRPRRRSWARWRVLRSSWCWPTKCCCSGCRSRSRSSSRAW